MLGWKMEQMLAPQHIIPRSCPRGRQQPTYGRGEGQKSRDDRRRDTRPLSCAFFFWFERFKFSK